PRLHLYVHAPGHRRAASGGRMSKRILVVEDQADNRQIIRDMLTQTDYEISEVESGEEALDAVAKAAARSDPDGYPTTDHGRVHGHAQNQGRSRNAIDPDHRGHLLCIERRGKEGPRGGL